MKTSTRIIPAGTNYLSDVLTALPFNCLFNKGVTGCGGTTIALTNDAPTVICVPYVSLADNKFIQSKNNRVLYPYEVFSVHGNVGRIVHTLCAGYSTFILYCYPF